MMTPGHDGIAGKVAGEERLVHGHVLDRLDALAGHALDDAVDEQERVAVRQLCQHLPHVHREAFAHSSPCPPFPPRPRPASSRCSRATARRHLPASIAGMPDEYMPGPGSECVTSE